jgi:hypothetical protein
LIDALPLWNAGPAIQARAGSTEVSH